MKIEAENGRQNYLQWPSVVVGRGKSNYVTESDTVEPIAKQISQQ